MKKDKLIRYGEEGQTDEEDDKIRRKIIAVKLTQ